MLPTIASPRHRRRRLYRYDCVIVGFVFISVAVTIVCGALGWYGPAIEWLIPVALYGNHAVSVLTDGRIGGRR